MLRRGVVFSLAVTALCGPHLRARASSTAHRDIADWLFDLYAAQSVRLSIANAVRARPPGTEETLAAHAPAMIRALARHRATFVGKMASALQSVIETEAAANILVAKTKAQPAQIDDDAKRILFEADAAFRRDSQDVIGAMTSDIALMIATTLGQSKQ